MMETETQQFNVPETIQITDTDRKQLNQYPVLKEAWMPFEIIGHKKDVTKKGNLRLTLDASPVDADGRVVKGVRTRLEIYPPIANPTVAGHTKPNTKLGCYFAAVALDNFPRKPRKIEGGGGYETPDGEVISAADGAKMAEESDQKLLDVMMGFWNDPKSLYGRRFNGLVEQDHNEDTGKTYTKISRTLPANETPINGEILTAGFVEGSEVTDE